MSCSSVNKAAALNACQAAVAAASDDSEYSVKCDPLAIYGGGDGSDTPPLCNNNYLTNNGQRSVDPRCLECYKNNPRENYVHAPPVPWARPGSYLNLNQTWGGQKPFQL